MLKNTFHHLPGIGALTERQIWSAGILAWDDFKEPNPLKWSSARTAACRVGLQTSQKYLLDNHPGYFTGHLPSSQHWRIFPEFRNTTAYLDIETTGMDPYDQSITTIALYDGRSVFYYIAGQNLERFKSDITRYGLIVTYNGKCFDIPFVEKDLNIRLPQAHIDLRYVLAGLGITGGLKRCEAKLGLARGDLAGVDGFFAVLLWNEYRQYKNTKALQTLLAYNIQDAVNLETLMVMAYNLKIKETPFASSHRMDLTPIPTVPFNPDPPTIAQIKQRYTFGNHFQGYNPTRG
ncbi:MAG: ribonuclease H-like domain-containing protein [Desulfobacterales bacterium]|nr:ribonuclease H-like domain-containing protein [Desulfobacterales bacterium]